jgi:hypothetical protein
LPTKKKSTKKVEPAPEEKCCEDSSYSSGSGAGFGANFKDMISKEAQMHIFRGISELALAMDTMMPRSQMPEEVKQHAKAAKREVLLMLRSMIDAHLSKVPEASQEPKFKKINVE